jgi:DNA-directed RNA polymerase subunit M/transcription elongation factor TFIIS
MSRSQDDRDVPQRICEQCEKEMSYVGKLPRIGTRPALIIYRCDECSRAVAEEA